MKRMQLAMPAAIVTVGLFCLVLSGCAGILGGGEDKPLRLEVTFTGADSLNFDGRSVQAVQAKAFILKDIQRFSSADPRAFFNPEFDPGFQESFGRDMLGSVTLSVAPGETRSATIEVPAAFIKREPRVYFGAIANFAQPPSERGKERMSFKLTKKSQRTAVQLNKNTVAQRAKP